MRDAVDVDAARHDVGRDQHRVAAALETLEGLFALLLGAVGVHDRALDAVLGELPLEAVGTVLGAREDQGPLGLWSRRNWTSESVFWSAVTG